MLLGFRNLGKFVQTSLFEKCGSDHFDLHSLSHDLEEWILHLSKSNPLGSVRELRIAKYRSGKMFEFQQLDNLQIFLINLINGPFFSHSRTMLESVHK